MSVLLTKSAVQVIGILGETTRPTWGVEKLRRNRLYTGLLKQDSLFQKCDSDHTDKLWHGLGYLWKICDAVALVDEISRNRLSISIFSYVQYLNSHLCLWFLLISVFSKQQMLNELENLQLLLTRHRLFHDRVKLADSWHF